MVGQRIKEERKRRNLTRKALAQMSGVAEISISQYETGKRQPRIEQLQRIAEALDISTDMLLFDNNNWWYEGDEGLVGQSESKNEAHEISEYILNTSIGRDSRVGRIVNGYKFQGCIHDLIRGLLEKDEREKDWLILTVQRLLELDKKYELTFNQLDDILFVIDSISSALSTDNPEMFEHITNVIKMKLEEVKTGQKNKANANKGMLINDDGEGDAHDPQE